MANYGMSSKDFQGFLKREGLYTGGIDGIEGTLTQQAAEKYLKTKYQKVPETARWAEWSKLVLNYSRLRLAVNQQVFADKGWLQGKVDGLYGPDTAYAVEQYQNWLRDQSLEDVAPTKPGNPSLRWPAYKDIQSFYGAPGTGQVIVTLPYPMRLAWDKRTSVTRATIHSKCSASFLKCLQDILDHYGYAQIQHLSLDLYGGTYAHRKMRGGTQWSVHAYSAALDLDPEGNPLRANHTTARFANPIYNKMFDIWAAEGWVSLGKERDYDWMHVQAARL